MVHRPRNPGKIIENLSLFDLNASLNLWLEKLAQSPHFRNENVAEMETHVRDSVTKLHSQGLSEEESFLIAIRRVGSIGKLEPEFAKVNRNRRSIIAHGLVLAFFSIGCLFLWWVLLVPQMMEGMLVKMSAQPLPAFSRLVMGCGSFLYVPPLLAAAYCIYVWIRKSRPTSSWMGFFATTVAILVLLTLLTVFAGLLPVIAFLNQLPAK